MSEMIDEERLAQAIARSLVTDGYIDLERTDGEEYLAKHSDPLRPGDIRAVAASIVREYEALFEVVA